VIPSGCGIGRAPDGSFKVTGRFADVAAWWFREMQGRAVGAGYFVRELLANPVTDEGVHFIEAEGGVVVVRTWPQVHADLGNAFLRASR
jgi:hypothetical protein